VLLKQVVWPWGIYCNMSCFVLQI